MLNENSEFVWVLSGLSFSLKAETRKDVQWCSSEWSIAEKTLRLDAGTEGDFLSSVVPDKIYFYIEMSPDRTQGRGFPRSLDAARNRELKAWEKRRSSRGSLNAQLYLKIAVGRRGSVRKTTVDACGYNHSVKTNTNWRCGNRVKDRLVMMENLWEKGWNRWQQSRRVAPEKKDSKMEITRDLRLRRYKYAIKELGGENT